MHRFFFRSPAISHYFELTVDELVDKISGSPDDIQLRLALCERHAQENDFELALAQARHAVCLSPDSPHALAWQAMCMMSTTEIVDGNELLSTLVRKYPCSEFHAWMTKELAPKFSTGSSNPLRVVWESHEQQHNYSNEYAKAAAFAKIIPLFEVDTDRCIAKLENHLTNFPDDTNALLFLAKTYRFTEKLSQAEPRYREVLAKDPEATVAMFDLATIVASKDPWEAIELMKTGLEICSFDNRAKCKLAEYENRVGRYQQAIDEIGVVPADSPYYADWLITIAHSHESLQNHDQALELLTKATLVAPKRGDIRGKYGQVLCDVGRFDEGLEELEIAASLDPHQYMHWANIGLMLQHVGRNQKAIAAFQNAAKINPNCSHVSNCLTKLLADSKTEA